MGNKIYIYKDINDSGISYTIYINGKCVGSYLEWEDCEELADLDISKNDILEGLDNREVF